MSVEIASIESMVRNFDRELQLFEEKHLSSLDGILCDGMEDGDDTSDVEVPAVPQSVDGFEDMRLGAYVSPASSPLRVSASRSSSSVYPSPPYFNGSSAPSSASRHIEAFANTPEHSFELAAAESEREQLHDRLNDLQCRVEQLEVYTKYQDDYIERLKRKNSALESKLRQSEAARLMHQLSPDIAMGGASLSFGVDVEHRLDMYRTRVSLMEVELQEARELLATSRLDQEALRAGLSSSEARREEECLRRILAEKQRDAYVAAYEEALAHIDKLGAAQQVALHQIQAQQAQLDLSRGRVTAARVAPDGRLASTSGGGSKGGGAATAGCDGSTDVASGDCSVSAASSNSSSSSRSASAEAGDRGAKQPSELSLLSTDAAAPTPSQPETPVSPSSTESSSYGWPLGGLIGLASSSFGY
jgi:hypothetical protein